MSHPRPPHLQRHKTRHGKFIWVVQVGHGPLIRINEEYGTPEFMAAYHAALNLPAQPIKRRAPQTTAGSLEWLWMMYRQSGAWKKLKPPTKKQRENIMLHVLKASGSVPAAAINKKSIQQALKDRADTPFQAKNFLQTMRQLYTWAVSENHVAADPTASLKVDKPKTGGFPEWTYDEILQYERRWPLGTRERVMLDVYCYTGLRRGDAARVGKQHVRGGVISLQTEKTGTWVHIPLLPVLRRTLDAGPTGDLSFIVTPAGKPYKKEALGNAFKTACVAAGILDKSAHGLRKAAATRAAEGGATVHQLMAIFGWTNVEQAELYTRAANRKHLAAAAIETLNKPET